MGVSESSSLLGSGHGVDHLVVAVRILDSARADYDRSLGFSMSGLGRHPQGTENSVARFEDDFYLELLGCYDPSKAADLARFLEKQEGAMSLGLNVSSAENTAAFLKTRGFEVETGSGTSTLEGAGEAPPVLWRWVALKEGTPLSDAIFFIEYTIERETFRKSHSENYAKTVHPNRAVKVGSVWMAVRNIEEAAKKYRSIGFAEGKAVKVPGMGASGREIPAGRGTILLLNPVGKDGKVGEFLAKRGDAFIGLSVQIGDLAPARRIIGEIGVPVETCNGLHGKSILIPPEVTHGVWLEVFQK